MRSLILVASFAACTGSSAGQLPGESMDNGPTRRGADSPCGGATDTDGDGTVDQTWAYDYDERGRSVRDVGHYTNGNPDEVSVYSWDNLDHLTGWVQTNAPDEMRMEYSLTYDTLGNELDYTFVDLYYDNTQMTYRQINRDFDDYGHPAHAIIQQTDLPDEGVTFTYDANGRLIARDRDDGLDGTIDSHATVVYDEDARTTTTTSTSVNGTNFTTVRTYDASYHLLSYHQDVVYTDHSEHVWDWTYEWKGDRVLADSFVSDGNLTSHDSYRYDCGSSRRTLRPVPVSRTTGR